MKKIVKGISMCNPTELDREYLIRCADYAIERGIGHFEIIGPTHSPVKGNCDGMMYYRKYAEFNSSKDREYVDFCIELVNEVTEKLSKHGIRSYYWHHELEIPYAFDEAYPEIHNSDGDVEVTHPLIKDFLVNKIEDFFFTYPHMSGIVLTLHETRIPLLKLKNQKLDKIERVKYVTEILYDTCKRLGKELIVRPFASWAQDYDDLMAAYERISSDLTVCDKWTQYDWSLTMPNNVFLNKIKNNELVIETDLGLEYFGKGFVPIMLKDHITRKFGESMKHNPRGFVSRIDRGGFYMLGTPNEVNLEIMDAVQDGRDVDEAIDAFFRREYGELAGEVRSLMEGTEDIQIMMFYINKVEFCMLSQFPSLSYLKTAQKVEMFRDEPELDSAAWYIPKNYTRPPLSELTETKRQAVVLSEKKLAEVKLLRGRLDEKKYYELYSRFYNMYAAALLWEQLTFVCIGFAMYFETKKQEYVKMAREAMERLLEIDKAGEAELGDDYYFRGISLSVAKTPEERAGVVTNIVKFVKEAGRAFELELAEIERLDAMGLLDYVICGGFSERHGLKKEINFSASLTTDEGLCRTAGSTRGKAWSMVNAHGWFSYDVKVKPGEVNRITVTGRGAEGHLDFAATVGDERFVFNKVGEGKLECAIDYKAPEGVDKVTVRIDRISAYMPYIHTITVK